MPASTTTPPFELVMRGKDTWTAYWASEKVRVAVAGTAQAPHPALLATLLDVTARWREVKQAIATFARGLAADHHVPLDPPTVGGFAARSCGFGEVLTFESIVATSIDAPHRALATFYTGYPDGYATFEVVLEHRVPIAISAFAS